ncbi:MAG: hypothetical protein IPJ46_18055 [Anaerolineales bacterium]|nr:hypothetical protein [Anaerolineales bacterium]
MAKPFSSLCEPHLFDGKPAIKTYKDILDTNIMLVVASMSAAGIAESHHLGIVPFGDGNCTIKHTSLHQIATIIEHYFSGHQIETQITCSNGRLNIALQQTYNNEILEWVEIIFEKE